MMVSGSPVRSQADHVEKHLIEVQGNTMGLGVGDLVTLLPDLDGGGELHPFWKPEGFAKQYLVLGAHYSLSIDQYETGTVAGRDEPFRATYQLQDNQTQYRPRRTLKKPLMGPQTAVVVGPERRTPHRGLLPNETEGCCVVLERGNARPRVVREIKTSRAVASLVSCTGRRTSPS